MAAEIALRRLNRLPPGSLVLDPMVGSGTVLRAAADCGLQGLGFDLDPLAVLMSRVWTQPLNTTALTKACRQVLAQAEASRDVSVPWIDEDPETANFVNYWFASRQQSDLRSLAVLLRQRRGPIGEALRLGLSRIIVTKRPGAGASLARDVSHSRPRRVLAESCYNVLDGFKKSIERLAQRLEGSPPSENVTIERGDARCLNIPDGAIDAVVTSPPYLNAIDYLRGHRLALVWLGYRLAELRGIRSNSIGAERAVTNKQESSNRVQDLLNRVPERDLLPPRVRGFLVRYAHDLVLLFQETARVLRSGGTATFVVGDCTLRGVFIENSALVKVAARGAGLRFFSQVRRPLENKRRYLPPPHLTQRTDFAKRMRAETIVTFVRD